MPLRNPVDTPTCATSATGIATTTQPNTTQQQDGWTVGQTPPAQYFNWIMNRGGQWFAWLNDINNQAFTWTSAQIFSALATFSAGLTSAALATFSAGLTVSAGSATFTGGLTSAAASSFSALVTFTAGVVTNALSLGGNLIFTGPANPAGTTAFTNTQTPKNVAKAWIYCQTTGAGAVTILDSFNVASAAIDGGNDLLLTFASAFANVNYCAISVPFNQTAWPSLGATKSTTAMSFGAVLSTLSRINQSTTVVTW